jgi:hypothetical protein
MTISRIFPALGIFIALVLLAGLPCCGEKAPSESTQGNKGEGNQQAVKEGIDHAGHQNEIGAERPKIPAKIPAAVMDSLRAKKERYKVTQDTYWDDKGGILANDFVEVHYPPGPTTVTHGMHVLEQIVFAREKCRAYWGAVPGEKLTVICSPELEDFKKQTGRDWWNYSEIKGNTITFQPIYILHQRGLGEIAIAHEYHEWAIGKLTGGKAPRLLVEGLASYLSGEKVVLQQQVQQLPEDEKKMTPDEVERTLQKESKMEKSRVAYYHAYRLVTGIIARYGDKALQSVVKRLGEGAQLDEAFREACGKSYRDVLTQVADYKGEG